MPRWFDEILQDVRLALRGLHASPAFTLTAVATLAVGIGVNATVFTAVNAILFKGFPLVRENDRLLYLSTFKGCCVSYPDFEDWRKQATSFEDLALTHGITVEYADGSGYAERREVTEVSSNVFRLTGVQPVLGRDFTAADDAPGAPLTAMLNYGFWERRYAKDPSAIGRTVHINGTPATIVGVMPQGYSFPQKVELWIPLVPTAETRDRNNRNTWFAVGRMKPGVTAETATAEIRAIGARLEAAYPETNRGLPPHVQTFDQFFIGAGAMQTYWALWGAVGFVLLIACSNLANLLLARAIGRSREMSLRMALGAGRWRIVRSLLVESTLLAVAGGVCAWVLASTATQVWTTAGGMSFSNGIVGTWFDDVLDFSMDGRAYLYLTGVSLLTGVLFGLAPALRLSRLDLYSTLKDGGRGATEGRRGRRLSSLLIAGEMAMAMMLLAGAGMMVRSFVNAASANAGFDPRNLLFALIELPASRYPNEAARIVFHERLRPALEAIPGVRDAAVTQSPPGWSGNWYAAEVEDAPESDPAKRPETWIVTIGEGYFRTLDVPLRAGRDFNVQDRAGTPAAIVNESFARRHWPGGDPLGRRVRFYSGAAATPWRTVVGVAPDIGQNIEGDAAPAIYVDYFQRPASGTWLLLRTSVPPGSLTDTLRRTLRDLDPDLPIGIGPEPLIARLSVRHRYRAFMAGLFSAFAGIALALAATGLYAVVAHSAAQRTQEMGVRIALGATASDLRQLILRQGIAPLSFGLSAGAAGSYVVYRLLESVLVRVPPGDPAPLLGAAVLLILAAALGCWIPARRAMRVDPVVALRHD